MRLVLVIYLLTEEWEIKVLGPPFCSYTLAVMAQNGYQDLFATATGCDVRHYIETHWLADLQIEYLDFGSSLQYAI